MSFREYLHEKAEESRHNESIAYLMFLAGTVFLIGGILVPLCLTTEPHWFIIIPYITQPEAGGILSLTLIISGLVLIFFGIFAGIHYSRDRGWYMQELHKANSIEESILQGKSTKGSRKNKNRIT